MKAPRLTLVMVWPPCVTVSYHVPVKGFLHYSEIGLKEDEQKTVTRTDAQCNMMQLYFLLRYRNLLPGFWLHKLAFNLDCNMTLIRQFSTL